MSQGETFIPFLKNNYCIYLFIYLVAGAYAEAGGHVRRVDLLFRHVRPGDPTQAERCAFAIKC